MKLNTCAAAIGILTIWLGGTNLSADENKAPAAAAASAGRVLARDLLQEHIAINTTSANGSTKAAEAMAAHLRSAGFADSDIQLLGPLAGSIHTPPPKHGLFRAKTPPGLHA